MPKLLILPAYPGALGGTTVSLALLLRGLLEIQAIDRVQVVVQSGSVLEHYLQAQGLTEGLVPIAAETPRQFLHAALQWVNRQPWDCPLLLETCVSADLLAVLALATPVLRLSGRPVYHFFHDLARSHNPWSNLLRRLTFRSFSSRALCNSLFTAKHIQEWGLNICGVLYQPVDLEQFQPHSCNPPPELVSILATGARLILTPSRISKPGDMNDKNLRAIAPVLAELKAMGEHYHAVIIGQDFSRDRSRSRDLQLQAEGLGVGDRFTILPPTFAIAEYYHHADLVLALAPREPFGRTVIEAIACGVPVIGSETGGIGEVLSQFAPQWMVDPANPEETAQKIRQIQLDPNTNKILADGKRWVEKHCQPKDYALKTLSIIEPSIAIPNKKPLSLEVP
uniref:Glycosyl transferase group 1 n=1 Tax=Cyanothece sp. (strain PCC 7425 / ATCC 29141) TaxID=395961 RepID=B8HQ72_CYAP4